MRTVYDPDTYQLKLPDHDHLLETRLDCHSDDELRYYIKLKREVKSWCDEQLRGPVDLSIFVDRKFHCPVVSFVTETDRMLFKLRWL
jgi:hypothetical protein